MKNIGLGLIAVVLLSLVAVSFAATTDTRVTIGGIEKVTMVSTNGGTSDYVRGIIRRAVVNGVASTGATYSITLQDNNGVDVLAGAGAALATNTVTSLTNLSIAVNDKLVTAQTVGGTNLVTTVVLYVSPY